jgi:CTP:molybdopterin cytidylyltransferase MocA
VRARVKRTVKTDSVAAIILAAGASTRSGSPKQLIRLGEETLFERTVRIAVEAGLDPVYGVVSANLPPALSGLLSAAGQMEERREGLSLALSEHLSQAI